MNTATKLIWNLLGHVGLFYWSFVITTYVLEVVG